eukprot:2859124-Rhodomonas_salina.1
MATAEVAKKKRSLEECCRMAEKKYPLVQLNRETVRKRSSTHPGLQPEPRGRCCHIPHEEEEKIVCIVETMRTMKLPVYHSTLFYLADTAIQGTVYEK